MNWKAKETDLFEEMYESDTGSFLYIEDTYKNDTLVDQTELGDWSDSRYEAKLQKWYQPEPQTLKTSDEFEDVEEFVEDIVGMDYDF